MKRGSTTGILTPNSNQCSGSTSTLRHLRSFALNHWQEKSWPQFSGIAKAFCWWITFHRRQLCVGHTTEKCWEICLRWSRKKEEECWLEVHCSCTTMHRHTSRIPQAVVKDIGFQQLSHPLYSPDLAPSDFCPILSSEEAPSWYKVLWWWWDQAATESYLDGMPQEFYLTGIKELFDRCNKCIDVKGDYIKK